MSLNLYIIASLVVAVVSNIPAEGNSQDSSEEDGCRHVTSCATCISQNYCMWCVTKSKCTSQSCGNDNIIYASESTGLMAGPQFCPRIVHSNEILILKSGKKSVISVKLTQIHLYMAFTPWKCQITFDGVQMTLPAMLLGDSVFCESVLFTNKLHVPYTNGSVSVMWDYSKTFDGSFSFKVCRCDLDPLCKAC